MTRGPVIRLPSAKYAWYDSIGIQQRTKIWEKKNCYEENIKCKKMEICRRNDQYTNEHPFLRLQSLTFSVLLSKGVYSQFFYDAFIEILLFFC